MESCDETENSLPFIDDTDDETTPKHYNLKIIENYKNKNRNIEITNQYPDENISKSLSPVAPLAEETECEVSDSRINDEEEKCKHLKRLPKQPGVKLVIKGCNSTINIQGLDDKSSITFKRKKGRIYPKVLEDQKKKTNFCNVEKPTEKVKKGRWKMLTRSLISKSARFDRRGLDERYPKYVLLKNEEEISQDSFPKMVAFNEKRQKENKNIETKTEFNLKKSFNNKTRPIVPMEKILARPKTGQKKKKLENRSLSENRNLDKKEIVRRRKSFGLERPPLEPSPPPVFNEIQGIIEDTLKFYPEAKLSPDQPPEYPQNTISPHVCHFCRDPCSCSLPSNQPPMYIPVYPPYSKPGHQYKHTKTQTNEGDFDQGDIIDKKNETDFQDLPFEILSNFFPRVVIMKAFQSEVSDDTVNETRQNYQLSTDCTKTSERMGTEFKPPAVLEVPQQNMSLKSNMLQTEVKSESEPVPSFFSGNFYVNCLSVNEVSNLDDEHKIKAEDGEATEFLHFCEAEPPENESVKPQCFTKKHDSEESGADFSLTKIGYKMYDNLTKLSLNHEKEPENQEIIGCGCNGSVIKNPPYNITLESNNRSLKVTVPENELNFQILNGGHIQIGVSAATKTQEEKKVVRKSDLWHTDNGRKDLVVVDEKLATEEQPKGSQKIKLSMADNKEVVVSIEMDGKEKEEEKPLKKSTKEIKVGTDDFDVAGGDFQFSFGGYKNLSPRTEQLLKNLQQKLELGEKERKFLTEKINEKLTDQKFQAGILPGIFLVKQISPRETPPKKFLRTSENKSKKQPQRPDTVAQLREYYCEDCLATMRVFEDEIPSVKNMIGQSLQSSFPVIPSHSQFPILNQPVVPLIHFSGFK